MVSFTLGIHLILLGVISTSTLSPATIQLQLNQGSMVRTTGQIAQINVGVGYCGRVVSALGSPIDGLGILQPEVKATRNIESLP